MKFIIKSSILFPKILLNYNCKDEEKSGSGKGSCGGNIDKKSADSIKWTETESFSKLFEDWKTGRFTPSDEDLELKEIIKEQGFDKKPKSIPESELNQIIASGGPELYRGFSSEQTSDQFKNGEYYIGKGLYGNGTYAAGNPDSAKLYGTNILHMTLDKSARIITEERLHQEQQEFIDIMESQKKYTPESEESDNKIGLLIHLAMDNGRFAALKGYDAIKLGHGNTIILNRGKILISDQEQKSVSYSKSNLAKSRNKIKSNESYLSEVYEFMKQNYNCPDSEKTGSGPGSCSGTSDKVESNESPLKSLPKVDIDAIKQKYRDSDPWGNNEAYHELSKVFIREQFKPTQGTQQPSYESALKTSIELMEENPKEFHDAITLGYTQDARDITKLLKEHPDLPVGKHYEYKGVDGIREYAKDLGVAIPKYYSNHPDFKEFNGQDNLEAIGQDVLTANTIEKMDNLFAKSKISDPITVYSGVDPRYFDTLPKDVGDQFEITSFISASRNESTGKGFASYALKQAQEGWSATDRSEWKPGQKYEGQEKTLIELQLSPGTKAIATEPAQAFAWTVYNKPDKWGPQSKIRNKETDSQEELIINRKTRFEVVGMKTSGKLKRLIVKTI